MSTDSHALAKNGFLQLAGRVVGMIFGLLTVMIATRALGDTAYGQFTNAFTFLAVLGSLADMGFTLTTIQLISEKGANEEHLLSTAFTARCISGVALFLLAIPVAGWMGYDEPTQLAIRIGTLSFFCMVGAQMLLGVFQKHLAMLKPSLVEAMSRAIVFLGVWAATASIATPATIMLAFLAGNVALFFANLHLARQIVPFRLGLDASTLRLFFSRSWPMALSILFNLIYLKGDIIFLHLFGRPLEEIGQYGAAYKVLDVIAVLPSIVMGLLLPRLTHAWSHNDRDGFVRHLQQAMDTFFVMAIPILVGGAFLANQVMTLVSGEGFAAAGSYLAVLLLANTSVFFGILFGHAVVALGKQKTVLPAYAATAALTTLLYWLWIPRFGATGAAWATVFSETFILLCTYGLVRQATKCVLHLGTAGKSLVAALYMALALIGANTVMTENLSLPYHLQTVLLLAVGVAVYSLLLMALGVLTPRMIRSLLATK